jgi:DNA-binding NtrC family response regulator
VSEDTEIIVGSGTRGGTSELGGEPHQHSLVRRFRLLVVDGPDRGKQCTSAGARLGIGSGETNDLMLRDRAVSRFHCVVTVEGGHAMVRDLQSRNGTVVNGTPIYHAELRDQAVLQLGQTRILFELGTDHVVIPLSDRTSFGEMVGAAPSMRATFYALECAADSDVSVLIEGDTGTGKELAAASIHKHSARREGPFVVVDCGSLPPNLIESELFGHRRGAFTGAAETRLGAFRQGCGGTVFLDEVGELPLDVQPKLLRALESREIKPVGEDAYEPIDVRLIAATNRNLRSEVNGRRFRHDLYYRLAVLQVRLPSLRERAEDLPLLVDTMLRAMGAADDPRATDLRSEQFIARLRAHSWPGNVRELRNYLERCLALRGTRVQLEDGEPAATETRSESVDTSQPLQTLREAAIRDLERRYVSTILREHSGNVKEAARAAGVSKTFFYRLMARYGIVAQDR